LGATQVVVSGFIPPSNVIKSIEEIYPTMLLLVPTMLGFAESLLKLHGKKLSGINLLISCGDRYNPKMDNRVMATFGVPVIEGYGITECSPALAVNPKPSVRKIGIVGPNLPMNCSYPEKLSWRNSERRPFLPCFRGVVPTKEGVLGCKDPSVISGYYHSPEIN